MHHNLPSAIGTRVLSDPRNDLGIAVDCIAAQMRDTHDNSSIRPKCETAPIPMARVEGIDPGRPIQFAQVSERRHSRVSEDEQKSGLHLLQNATVHRPTSVGRSLVFASSCTDTAEED